MAGPKILLFVGAGFSKALGGHSMETLTKGVLNKLSPEDFPTKGVEGKVRARLLSNIREHLLHGEDIEWLLSVLNTGASDTCQHFLDVVLPILTESSGDESEQRIRNVLRTTCEAVHNMVRKHIADECVQSDPKEAGSALRKFLAVLRSLCFVANARMQRFPIVTTNYDCILEEYFQDVENREIANGFRRYGGPIYVWCSGLLEEQFRRNMEDQDKEEDEQQTSVGEGEQVVIKPHGSIDWGMTEDGGVVRTGVAASGATLAGGGRLEGALIYPLGEKEIYRDPFFSHFSLFKRVLQSTDLAYLIVVGYKFRADPVTNAICEGMLTNGTVKIVLLDPNADELARKLQEGAWHQCRGRVIPIPGNFGEEQGFERLMQLFEKQLSMSMLIPAFSKVGNWEALYGETNFILGQLVVRNVGTTRFKGEWEDFELHCRVNLERRSGAGPDFCVTFRHSDNSFYQLALTAIQSGSEGMAILHRVRAEHGRMVKDRADKVMENRIGPLFSPHQMRITVRGDLVQVSIDGRQVLAYRDKQPLPKGGVGIRVNGIESVVSTLAVKRL